MITNRKIYRAFSAVKILILSIMLMLTGCSDLAEVQDRDFVLALGVSVKNGKYELTFGLPDLSMLTKGGTDGDENGESGQTRTYESPSLTEIEYLYNHGSNKRLDYRHLEALILDESISKSPNELLKLFEFMDNNYQISRDVRGFYYSGDVKKLIEEKGKIKGGIGDYLEKLEKNNQRKNGLQSITLGNLIDCIYQKKDILIPIIKLEEDKLEVEGAAVFQDSIIRKKITEEELKIYYVIKGQGKEYNFYTENGIDFKLKELKSKTKYQFQNSNPTINFSITGVAEIISDKTNEEDLRHEINTYLIDAISNQISTYFKTEQLDYLNLYSESSLKNRDIWIAYQERLLDFINDTEVAIDLDIKIQ